ncbi:hypothetical protein INT47_000758 [Mucor saturninus]|uniref:Uncharacterized protein n=1 Tax=Mucor saturninus TaxID=64648 RepID=A0A8H7QUA1_9FUNG|nr:hypothetical protein INT47_000758 [Mucor saturninus]
MIIFAKSIRLVVLDYAGLSKDPTDIKNFIRELTSTKEVVVYHGHKFESIPRQNVLHGKTIKRFDCRPGYVKRSLM